MPYIVTTWTPPATAAVPPHLRAMSPDRIMKAYGHATRRAVATLDEARRTVELGVIERHRASPRQWARDWQIEAHRLPDDGGTVGPLPDGTTIEVEHVEWDSIARAVKSHSRGEPCDRVAAGLMLAAWNERQEASA